MTTDQDRLDEAARCFNKGQFAIAENLCHQILAGQPDHGGALRQLALAYLAQGAFARALPVLQSIPDIGPDDSWVHMALGMAVMAVQSHADAVPHFRQAIASGEKTPEARLFLGNCLTRSGQAPEAVVLLREAVAQWPGSADLHISLGQALAAANDFPAARDIFAAATRLDPNAVLAWSGLGEAKQDLQEPDAVDAYARAVALAPQSRELHGKLAALLHAAGRQAEARTHFHLGMPWSSLPRAPDPRGRLRLCVLAANGRLNTPVKFVLNSSAVLAEDVLVMDGFDYPADFMAREYDVVFNGIADADSCAPILTMAEQVMAPIGLPVLNPPARILDTTRDRIAARLADVAGAHVPVTLRYNRAEFIASGAVLPDALQFPVLVRPVGSHGGFDIVKVDDSAALHDCLARTQCDTLYLTQFVDYGSADGGHRKFRLMFIDGEIYPVHLSISAGWLNHYFRSDMAKNDAFRAEEQVFLDNPVRTFGSGAMAALREIGRRIGLDYFGIDCALDREGKLLLFECNASMLVFMPYQDMYEYRRGPVHRIRDAFTAMLRSRVETRNLKSV